MQVTSDGVTMMVVFKLRIITITKKIVIKLIYEQSTQMKVLTFKKMTKNDDPLKKNDKKKKRKKMTHWTACKKHNSYLPGPFNVLPKTNIEKNYTSEKSKNPDCLMGYPDFPQSFAEYTQNPDHFSKS